MHNRTYRYFTGKPLYGFGYGLSYTTFAYSQMRMPRTISAGDYLPVAVTVTNTGPMAGDEVIEVYLTQPRGFETPRRVLADFFRLHLQAGQSSEAHLNLNPRTIAQVDEKGNRVILPGTYTVTVGGGQPGTSFSTQTAPFTMTGTKQLPK
jgi:beta-glucosidase